MKKNVAAKTFTAGLVSAVVFANAVYAAQNFTFDEALNLAISESSELKNLNENIDVYKDNLVSATGSALSYGATAENIDVINNSFNAISQMYALRGSIKSSRIKTDYTKEMLEYALVSSLASIESSKESLILQQKQYQHSLDELEINRIKARLNLLSETNVKKAEEDIKTAELNIEKTKANIDLLYDTLGYVLGLDSDDEYDIEYSIPEYCALDTGFNINTHIEKTLYGNSYVRSLTETVKAAKLSDKYGGSDTETTSSQSKRSAIESLELALRTQYDDIRKLESSIAENKLALKSAEQALSKSRSQFAVGGISSMDLKQAELNVENAKCALLSNQINHYVKVYELQHPVTLITIN